MAQVLENRSALSSSSTEGDASLADHNQDGGKVVFNEQTNYVPKRTIIIVSFFSLPVLLLFLFSRWERRKESESTPVAKV